MKPFSSVRLCLVTALLTAGLVIGYQYHVDLVVFHSVAQWASAGEELGKIYTERAANNGGRFFYGPLAVVLLEPLGHLSFEQAKLVWLALQTFSYLLIWWGLYRLYPFLLRSLWYWLPVFFFALNPLHNNFQSNNIQMMLLAALIAAELLTRSPSKWAQRAGGALCAATAFVKVFPAFICLLYLVVKRRAVKQGVLAGSVVLLYLPFARYGIDLGSQLYFDFYQSLFAYHGDNDLVNKHDILCLASMLARLLDGMAPLVFQIAYVTLSGLLSGIFFLSAWQTKDNASLEEQRDVWALGLALMTLINPSSLVHYIVFYIPAFCSICQFAVSSPRKISLGTIAAAGSMVLIAFTMQGITGKPLNDYLEHLNIPTVGFILLVVSLFAALYLSRGKLGSLSSGTESFATIDRFSLR